MTEDLLNEQEAINAIYGSHTLEPSTELEYLLTLPNQSIILRLYLPLGYPKEPPQILATVTVGDSLHKGFGSDILIRAREALNQVFVPGAVCMFDLLQELESIYGTTPQPSEDHSSQDGGKASSAVTPCCNDNNQSFDRSSNSDPPSWAISSTLTLKKSVFVAHACRVMSPSQTKTALVHLLANDRHVAKATHNVTAYRIRAPAASIRDSVRTQVAYQDCDDDGETAAGCRLLHLLHVMDVWDVFVVVSRWYGGVQLGPDRFRLISQAAQEAIIEGRWQKGGGRIDDVR